MTFLTDLAALDAALDEACPHYAQHDGWTLEHHGEYAGLWVHADPDCRRPSQANLSRVEANVLEGSCEL